MAAYLIWHGVMLPPTEHSKPCKLCGETIQVGQQFGLLRSPGYPGRKHHVCHVKCFDEASGGVTPEREPVEVPETMVAVTAAEGEIDLRELGKDWK